jgi:hypothetical protein
MLAEALHVGDQMVGRVVAHVRGRIACVRCALPAAALIEEHGPVASRIEQLPHSRRDALAGAAVDHHGRLAVRVPAGLPVHEVAVADIEQPLIVRLDRRIELGH